MGEGAQIESIDALRHFRVALIKFTESANVALMDAESDMSDALNWLEHEQTSHWQTQIRKRHDEIERAKEALRMKRLFRDSAGRIPYAIEEEKALRKAQLRFEEAEQKSQNVKKYIRILQREIHAYKGAAQRLSTTLAADMPVAVTLLNDFAATIEEYARLSPEQRTVEPPSPADTIPET